MMKKSLLSIIFLFFVFLLIVQSVVAENMVVVDFYYSTSCGSCKPPKEVMEEIQEYYAINYSEIVIINFKEVGSNTTNSQEMRDRGLSFPVAIVNNETKIPKNNITFYEVQTIIDAYIQNIEINQTFDEDTLWIDIPFIGTISVNLSGLSLPVLTIILGAVDSINPCSIFILFILLSLLVYAQSRRRMLLVGGIFIFFSGLWYFIFMFILIRTLGLLEAVLVSIVVGIIAIIFGIFNIKDFFFPKKGASLSIPEEKKPGLYRQMRSIVKTPYLFGAIVGTVLLAVTVNLFELICSLQWPLYYVARLSMYDFPEVQNYLYILFYNIVYVIPLIVIVLLFVFSLGRMKLTEWQGQKLKLFSGIMILSLGLLMIISYQLLENFAAPILILVFSIVSTLIISHIWKKYKYQSVKEQLKES